MNSREEQVARARRGDPGELLVKKYGARLGKYSQSKHKCREFVLPSGTKVGITERPDHFVWIVDSDTTRGGIGCIDLVVELDGCTVREAILELCPGINHGHGVQSQPQANRSVVGEMSERHSDDRLPARPKQKSAAPPVSDANWPRVRLWLVGVRGLPAKLVDHVYCLGLVHADARANAVFVRENGGAFLRGTGPTRFFQSVGGIGAGLFTIPGDQHVVLCEAPIDACSIKAMAPRCHVMATGGSMFSADSVSRMLPLGKSPVLAFDSDAAGREFTAAALAVWPNAVVREPDSSMGWKDWNDVVKAAPDRVHKDWI